MTQLIEKQLQQCTMLLQLELEARQAKSLEEISFIMVNRIMTVLSADTIVFWRVSGDKIEVVRISNIAQIDQQSPFINWIKRIAKERLQSERATETHQLGKDHDQQLDKMTQSFGAQRVLWCPLIAPETEYSEAKMLGGLLLLRKDAWQVSELGVAERFSVTFSHALQALLVQSRKKTIKWRLQKPFVLVIIPLLLVLFLMIPIQQSVLAPAKVVARNPYVVSAPLDGVIESVEVKANTPVRTQQVLLSFDQTTIKNRHEVAVKALHVAKAKYMKAQQLAFADNDIKASLPLLQAQVERRSSEVNYAAYALSRTVVRAQTDGIALMNNPNDWRGKPVIVGERIMMIANPADVELEIYLPINDIITLPNNATVVLFLNIKPLQPLYAELNQMSYDANLTPEGILAYRLQANFIDTKMLPRIGLRGIAKVMGQRVSLFYYLFRRPLTALRQAIGL